MHLMKSVKICNTDSLMKYSRLLSACFALSVALVLSPSSAEAFPFGKKKDKEESPEKEESKKGWGAKIGGALGGVGNTIKNVGEGAGTAIRSKLPGQEDAGREKVETIIRETHGEMVATRDDLEADYDELRGRFLRIVGITEEDSALAPESSLLYEVQRFDSALADLEVPSVEAVQTKVGIGMDAFMDTSGALDHAKYASTAELLTEQIGPRAEQLHSLLAAELETGDKRRVVRAFDALSEATDRTVQAQAAFVRDARALEKKAYEAVEESKANFRDSMAQLGGIIAANAVMSKQAMDFLDVDSSEQEKILISYLGVEATDPVINMFKVMAVDGGFWDGVDSRADEMVVLSKEIHETVGSVYEKFGTAHAQVARIAEEIGEDRITGYFADAVEMQSELSGEAPE